MSVLNSKTCRNCGELKDFDAFHKDASKKDGKSWQCKECYAKYHKANADIINKRRKNHHISVDKEAARAKYKKWYAENFRKVQNKFYMSKYGMTVEQVLQEIENQDSKCKICKDELKEGRQTHVDHCHKTGKFRGMLCHKCNTKLGWYEKNESSVNMYLKTARQDITEFMPSYVLLN